MKYLIVKSNYPRVLAKEIMAYLEAGWELQGGVSMVNTQGNYSEYCQAITKTK